jgi:hypothetical protein
MSRFIVSRRDLPGMVVIRKEDWKDQRPKTTKLSEMSDGKKDVQRNR